MARSTVRVKADKPDPHRRDEVEKYLDSKSVKWNYIPDMKLADFDVNRSLANQARFEALKEDLVEEYTESVKRGDDLPAIIASYVGKRLVVIDGNHRLHSWINSGWETIPVYIVEADSQTITLMTYEANTKHGLRTSEDERIQHALWLMDRGTTQAKAAEITGLTLSKIKIAWEKSKAESRARRMSIRDWNSINTGVRSRLAQIRTDEGFEAAARLAVEAKLDTKETNDLVTGVNRSKSGEGQVKIVDEIRQTYIDRIQKTGGGVHTKRMNTPFGSFRIAAGMLAKWDYSDIIKDLHTPAEYEQTIEQAESMVTKLGLVIGELKDRLDEGKTP